MDFILIVFGLALAFVVALIAGAKGRSPAGWFLIGFLLPVIGLILILVMPKTAERAERDLLTSGDMKSCPFCSETIKRTAKVCRYCNRDLVAPAPSSA